MILSWLQVWFCEGCINNFVKITWEFLWSGEPPRPCSGVRSGRTEIIKLLFCSLNVQLESARKVLKRKQELWLLIPAAVWWEGVLPSSSSRPCCNGCLGYCEIPDTSSLTWLLVNDQNLQYWSSAKRSLMIKILHTLVMAAAARRESWWYLPSSVEVFPFRIYIKSYGQVCKCWANI